MSLFLLICCATALIVVGIFFVAAGSCFLGRPLSKGCGKTSCCRKTHCDNVHKNRSVDTAHDHNPPHST